ncbi:AzlD domain-containing protein [Paenibacillus sp. RC84]|uniref:AzlD domain-containing protein n=1 Tax=Paenibacillus sp. RC84 TaxID=3156252 RepID=UPI00351569D2
MITNRPVSETEKRSDGDSFFQGVEDRWLRHVPVAVMAALPARELLLTDGRLSAADHAYKLPGALSAPAVAVYTRSLFGTVIAGMLSLAAHRFFSKTHQKRHQVPPNWLVRMSFCLLNPLSRIRRGEQPARTFRGRANCRGQGPLRYRPG